MWGKHRRCLALLGVTRLLPRLAGRFLKGFLNGHADSFVQAADDLNFFLYVRQCLAQALKLIGAEAPDVGVADGHILGKEPGILSVSAPVPKDELHLVVVVEEIFVSGKLSVLHG